MTYCDHVDSRIYETLSCTACQPILHMNFNFSTMVASAGIFPFNFSAISEEVFALSVASELPAINQNRNEPISHVLDDPRSGISGFSTPKRQLSRQQTSDDSEECLRSLYRIIITWKRSNKFDVWRLIDWYFLPKIRRKNSCNKPSLNWTELSNWINKKQISIEKGGAEKFPAKTRKNIDRGKNTLVSSTPVSFES